MAMCLAAKMEPDDTYMKWDIYSDSQAAIQAVNKPGRQSGQSIIKEFLDDVDAIADEKPYLPIVITWIPGHSEIAGNERADLEAKKAAINQTDQPFHHRPLKSARARRIKADANRQWAELWKNTKTARNFRRMLKRRDVKAGRKFYNSIPSRNTATTLARLRTGHCGLNYYLHRFNLARTPYCSCGYAKETVEHYLLECRLYYKERKELRKKIGPGKLTVDRLLGVPRFSKHTMEYVESTKGKQI